MIILNAPNPIAFNLFNIPIYWYGIFMASAIFVAILLANLFFNKTNPEISKDKILEYSPYIIFSGIFGARLYYCLLNLHYYLLRPLEIFNVRQGGLSIHGAILGGILCLICLSKHTKTPLFKYLDAISATTILGQAIGRWGNYFNSEAYGLPVKSQTWGLFIPESQRLKEFADISLYHPTFLYESLLDLTGFGILTFLYFKFHKINGFTFFAYLTIYSIIRFFIEQIRVDSALNIGNIPIAIIMSITLFLIGILGLGSLTSQYLHNRK